MELGDYFSNVFGKIFNKDLYWPTLVLNLIVGVIFGIFALIFSAIMLAGITTSLTSASITSLMTGDGLGKLLRLSTGLIIGLIVFGLITLYLSSVIAVFVVNRINAIDAKKKIEFFEGLGSCFNTGFKLFIALLIYYIAIGIILFILSLIALIPFIGIVIAIILGIALTLYVIVGCLSMIGKIALGAGIVQGLGIAFTQAFKKPILLVYGLVLGFVCAIMGLVSGLISMIPVVGWIAMIFILPIISAYMFCIAYYFAKE